jgi:glycosyltransferase involved in cell wall biosynthesis
MKKNFIIYAPAINSRTGGAHSILENFLKSLRTRPAIEATWQFIGNSEYESICAQSKLEFHSLDLNKKWLLRIIYDFLLFKIKFLNGQAPAIIISMQNTTPITRSCDSTLTYVHQAIPFIKNFKPDPIKNFKLFLIKKFYFFFIKFGIDRKRAFFILQSEWLKKICSIKLGVSEDHFFIHRPMPTDINLVEFTNKQIVPNTYFYPSLFQNYKNHKLLIEAFIRIANNRPEQNFVLELTIEAIPVECPINLKILFHGMLSRKTTLLKINNAEVVIYPSLIESYGMPIAEAIFLKTPVIASDLPYARELLGENGIYFNPLSVESLTNTILEFSTKNYQEIKISKEKFQDWESVLANFLNKINK